jgi:hypothetical protein
MTNDVRARIRDIETVARCADIAKPNEPYVPPRRGVFRISISDTYVFGENSRAMTEEQVQLSLFLHLFYIMLDSVRI